MEIFTKTKCPHLKWARAAMAATLQQSMMFPSWFMTFTSTRICQTYDGNKNLIETPYCNKLLLIIKRPNSLPAQFHCPTVSKL